MKGFILNHIYSIEKSLRYNIFLTAALVMVLSFSQNQTALNIAAFLPFLLMTPPAFEVLKHDAVSGWNKFVITLPVKRSTFVQSHYLTFLLLFAGSALLALLLFYLADLFMAPIFTESLFNYLFRGMGLALCLAVLLYPLTFKLGAEKSDLIMIVSIGFAFGVFFSVSSLLQGIVGSIEGFERLFSVSFLAVSLFLLLVSYLMSVRIYNQKEF